MNRSKDLDTIAPDDPIINPTESVNIFEQEPKDFPKINHPKKIKIFKTKPNQKITLEIARNNLSMVL